MNPDKAFDAVTRVMRRDPLVSEGRMFGSSGLKVSGKVFAMLVKGELVVKLPRARVEELEASGMGHPFDPGHGRIMREWVAVFPAAVDRWRGLAREAREFVGPI